MAGEVSIEIIVVGLDAMQQAFAHGTTVSFKEVNGFEKSFAAAFAATKAKVHVQTGYLLGSGMIATHFDGDEWEGEMSFARYPGIFELARGDSPTANHPEGGHFFFNAVEPFLPEFDDNVDAVWRAIFNDSAPI